MAVLRAFTLAKLSHKYSSNFGAKLSHKLKIDVTLVKLRNFLSTIKKPLEKAMTSMIWLKHSNKLLIVYRSGLSGGQFNLSHC